MNLIHQEVGHVLVVDVQDQAGFVLVNSFWGSFCGVGVVVWVCFFVVRWGCGWCFLKGCVFEGFGIS